MKKLLLTITALAFLFVACEKDSQEVATESQVSNVEFKIDQSNFDLKNTLPECDDDAIWDHVVFTIEDADGNSLIYTSPINYIGDEYLTQVIKLLPGNYLLTSFMVYDDQGNIIRAAPKNTSIYYDLMTYQLDLEFAVEPFYKKQIAIDVLCYEELAFDDFGFTWIEFNDVRIERQCVFGDLCIDDYSTYIGSLYDIPGQGVQFDMPAIIKVKVFKGNATEPLRVFSNEDTYGNGECLEIYWPNRIAEVGEEFHIELYVWLPSLNGFDYILMDTWNFLDGDGAITGEDGVVDFVVGDCQIDDADYTYDYSVLGTGDVQITLTWDNTADLDLWVTDPFGETIKWTNTSSASGGQLDVDDTNGYGPENIYWPPDAAPPGEYLVQVHHFSGDFPTDYTIQILFFGNNTTYTGSINDDELVDIATLNASKSAVTPLNKRQKLAPMPPK